MEPAVVLFVGERLPDPEPARGEWKVDGEREIGGGDREREQGPGRVCR